MYVYIYIILLYHVILHMKTYNNLVTGTCFSWSKLFQVLLQIIGERDVASSNM